VVPGLQITLAAAALVADDPRQAVKLRDQAEAVPAVLNGGAAFYWLRRLVADDGRASHNREAMFGLIDLAEAGRRTGRLAEASELIEGAFAATEGELSPRLLQARALCRALLAVGGPAEEHYLQALAVTEGDQVPFERARVQLSYGQWLHRERRDKDARPYLNAAAHIFRRLAAAPWLEAATHEQRAAGVRSPSLPPDALSCLSPSERQVVLLAAEGLTNPEIAARLFVSPRTVGSHLYRSFTKLDVSRRAPICLLLSPAAASSATCSSCAVSGSAWPISPRRLVAAVAASSAAARSAQADAPKSSKAVSAAWRWCRDRVISRDRRNRSPYSRCTRATSNGHHRAPGSASAASNSPAPRPSGASIAATAPVSSALRASSSRTAVARSAPSPPGAVPGTREAARSGIVS